MELPYAGLRVVERSGGIAGAYCGKLFVDAGAEVALIEPPSGHPLRRSALFDYLAAGKKSVGDAPPVDVDLVIVDDRSDLTWVRSALPPDAPTVVVAVTPFGLDGPYVDADVRANEFLLQALCGSIGSRGMPGDEPLQVGGGVGEWVAGVYAAVAASAALRRARRTGRGDTIDVSMLECMLVTMGGLGAVTTGVLGADAPVTGRTLELPSIVPTADGLVGFCMITAQQFADFLAMIDRPDLLEDRDLSSLAGRLRRRDEFLGIVHAWAATRTTEEIIELAAAMRIPVAPIGTPRTVTGIDHFAARGVFVRNAAGLPQPRRPYRSPDLADVPPGPVPSPGTSPVTWAPRSRAAEPRRPWAAEPRRSRVAETVAPGGRPLDGVRVTDFTAFWAGPTATLTLAALGADVVKVEGLRRPDGMRFSGGRPPSWDRWWEWSPFFLASNADKRDVTLELSTPRARELALGLIAASDLVIENFSPRVMGNLGLEWDAVHAANPATVLVRMPAFGLDGPWRDRVGFAQTMEQASGMAWMTGYRDGPPVIPRGVCDPLAGLHAAFAALAALAVRDRTGTGLQVEATMVEAALNVAAGAVLEAAGAGGLSGGDGASRGGGPEPRRDGNRGPGAAPQGVYRCTGDDEWLALAVLDDAGWRGLAGLLDRLPGVADRGARGLTDRPELATEAGRRAAADELDIAIVAWAADLAVGTAVERLRAVGVGAARVTPAADLLDDEQLRARGFWEKVTHPAAGTFLTTGMPFRFASIDEPWIRRPAPTLGQHNADVLGTVLGLGPEQIGALEDEQVLGVRPAGL